MNCVGPGVTEGWSVLDRGQVGPATVARRVMTHRRGPPVRGGSDGSSAGSGEPTTARNGRIRISHLVHGLLKGDPSVAVGLREELQS